MSSSRLFDGRGREADGIVTVASGDLLEIEAGVVDVVELDAPPVVLVLGVPKGGKLETVVRMCTELGVLAVHLAVCERSVARPNAERAASRVQRLSRVARDAARRSRRAHVPEIVAPGPLLEVAGRAGSGSRRIVLWEGSPPGFRLPDGDGPAWIVVGPEGGLSEAEVSGLAELGYRPAGLGRTILRVETAAPVAVALCLDRMGAFSP